MDEIDRKVVAALQENGRASLKKIGEILGFTSMGAKKRLDKLLKSGMIKVSALVNVKKAKAYAAILLLEVNSSAAMKRILEKFKKCPRVVYVCSTIGGYNMLVMTVAEDLSTLESESLEVCSIRSQPGVRRSEFYPIGEIYYSPYLPVRVNLASRSREKAPCGAVCKNCERYASNKCRACPSTIYYRSSADSLF
ncbi:MAG: Lrp/AsnC family transcriptional regulator [Thermoproteota archaeon]|nr:MAG: Lrp/AsnC family transcriptional regulator [Candidatus Korarchaeota archaeon]RLG53403.1 MAG: Lrp/AsnC family transcriptional regulator [Candidatus Korarchaeota archaeon]